MVIKLLGIAKNCIKMYLNKDIKLIRFDVKRRKYEVKADPSTQIDPL